MIAVAQDPISEIVYWKGAKWVSTSYEVGKDSKGIQLVIYHPATMGAIGSATLRADTPAELAAAKRKLVDWANECAKGRR